MTAWGSTHFLSVLLYSKCLANDTLQRLGNILSLPQRWGLCSAIYRHDFQALTSPAYALCKWKVSWLFSWGQPCLDEVSILPPLFCLIASQAPPALFLYKIEEWEWGDSVAVGCGEIISSENTTCFNLKGCF